MNVDEITKNIMSTCEKLGSNGLTDVPLDSADSRLLEINEANFDEHVVMQPIAVAYYGQLRKEAQRSLAIAKRDKERWFRDRFLMTKTRLKGTKATIKDLEAMVFQDYKDELDEIDGKIDDVTRQVDTLEVWYEAWRAKSYAMAELGKILQDEYRTPSSINRREIADKPIGKEEVRSIIRGNRRAT